MQLEPNLTKIVNLVVSGNYIFVSGFHVALSLARQNCELQYVTIPGMFVENESFIFRKNDPRLPQINRATINALSFVHHVDEKYRKALESDCIDLAENSSPHGQPLDIISLSGTLFLVFCGSVCALSLFALEICWRDSDSLASRIVTHMKIMFGMDSKSLYTKSSAQVDVL